MSTLTARLDRILADNNFKKVDLAKALGMSRSGISTIYSRGTITNQTAKQIADLFNINVDWLLNGTGEMKKSLSWEDEVAQIAVNMYGDKFIEERIDLIKLVQSLDIEDIRMLNKMYEKYHEFKRSKDAIKKEEQD